MEIELFNKEKHGKDLLEWCEKHNMKIELDSLPKVGVIVPGVAVAFLLQTDTPTAYIECLISNPEVDNDKRREGLIKVIDGVFRAARHLGFGQLLAISNIPRVWEYAEEFQMEQVMENIKMFRRNK